MRRLLPKPLRIFVGKRSSRGFTLAELLIVVAIVAILAICSILLITSKIEKARATTCDANCRSLQADIAYDYLTKDDMPGLEGTIISNAALRSNYGDTFDFDTFCPSGGTISAIKHINTDYSVGIKVYCTEHNPFHEWSKGVEFKQEDLMISALPNSDYFLIFRCMKSHKTGSRSNTRNPAVKSNKGTWEVIGTVDGTIPKYNPTVRFGVGFVVQYNGNKYARTNYNLTGGQTPYSKSSSRYWTLIGPMD